MSHTIKIQFVDFDDDSETFKTYGSASFLEEGVDKNEKNDDESETCNETEINDLKMAISRYEELCHP